MASATSYTNMAASVSGGSKRAGGRDLSREAAETIVRSLIRLSPRELLRWQLDHPTNASLYHKAWLIRQSPA